MAKIKHLQGLRGIAALAVFLSHIQLALFNGYYFAFFFLPSNKSSFTSTILKYCIKQLLILFTDGKLAVWIFWLLSAYVISILFFRKDQPYDKVLVGAFAKRYTRLVIPVFFSILFAYLLMQTGWMYSLFGSQFNPPNTGLSSLYDFKPDILLAIKDAFFTTFFNYRQYPSYNTVLWTIQPEFIGSIFIFGIFGIVRHNKKRCILYATIIAVLTALHAFPLLIFVTGYILCDYDFSAFENKWVLFLKRAEASIHKYPLVIFISTITCIFFAYPIMDLLHIPHDKERMFLSIFIIYFCLRNDYYKKILSSPLPYWLGKISFSLYLLHVPIICSLACFIVFRNDTIEGRIIASTITILISLPLSGLYTKYVDNGAISLSNKIGDYFKKFV